VSIFNKITHLIKQVEEQDCCCDCEQEEEIEVCENLDDDYYCSIGCPSINLENGDECPFVEELSFDECPCYSISEEDYDEQEQQESIYESKVIVKRLKRKKCGS
jgi:hypothetical protein